MGSEMCIRDSPDTCSLEGCNSPSDNAVLNDDVEWTTLLERQKLQAHSEHEFVEEIIAKPAVTHVRFNIFPDGGVSRLRLFGKVVL